jgi:hypothetical protein
LLHWGFGGAHWTHFLPPCSCWPRSGWLASAPNSSAVEVFSGADSVCQQGLLNWQWCRRTPAAQTPGCQGGERSNGQQFYRIFRYITRCAVIRTMQSGCNIYCYNICRLSPQSLARRNQIMARQFSLARNVAGNSVVRQSCDDVSRILKIRASS